MSNLLKDQRIGYKFLLQFARNGDIVGNIEFCEDGKYSKHDLMFKQTNSQGYLAKSGAEIKSVNNKPDNKLTITWKIHTFYDDKRSNIDRAITNGHEAFVNLDRPDHWLDNLIKVFDSGKV